MKFILSTIAILFVFAAFGQNPVGFDKMVERYIKGTIPTISPAELNKVLSSADDAVILDTRELGEYRVSHIENAIHVGYDHFKMEPLKDISKEKPVYLYCSVGYRSEKIGEKLKANGFTDVHNLYGGIFNWANNGYPVVNNTGKSTSKVHGFNKRWSKWLNSEKTKAILK